jgi:hypothetical protein
MRKKYGKFVINKKINTMGKNFLDRFLLKTKDKNLRNAIFYLSENKQLMTF